MRNLALKLLVTVVLAFPVVFVFVRGMESTQRFDSLGTWYTLYVAAFFTALVASVVLAVALVRNRRRSRRPHGPEL
jgi:uncharacterized membrane protein